MWRCGSLLIARRGVPFPDRCVKTNEPAHGRRIQQGLMWHPAWVYLTHLLTPWVYAVLARRFSREVTIDIGVCERVFRKRRRGLLLAGIVVVAGFAMMICGIEMIHQGMIGAVLVAGGILVVLAAIFLGMNASLIISPKWITDEFIWIKGIHPDFLGELPEWQGEDAPQR